MSYNSNNNSQRQVHQQRLHDLLEAVKQEFEFAFNEASSFKMYRDEFDLKFTQQTSEMQQIRQTVYELEMAHRKIKEAYEDEIVRLKTELDSRRIPQQPPQPQNQPPPTQQGQINGDSRLQPLAIPPQQQIGQIGQVGQPQKFTYPQQLPPPVTNQLPPTQSQLNTPQPLQQTPKLSQSQTLPPQIHPIQQAAQTEPPHSNQQTPKVEDASASTQLIPSSNTSNNLPPAQQQKTGSAHNTPTQPSALTIVDPNAYQVAAQKRNHHNKAIPPFLSDLDAASSNLKKQKDDYYVLYNPAFAKNLDVDLVHSLDHSSVVCCVRFSKDGKFLATGCNKTTQVFNVETGELVAKLMDESSISADGSTTATGDLYIRSVCFSPDGKFLATGAEDKLIRIWDLSSRRITKILKGHDQDIYSLDFFPDGNRLVSGSGDRSVRIWDIRSAQCSLTLSIEDGVTTVAVSPNGKLIAAGSLDRTVRVWDASTGFLIERLDSENEQGNGHRDSVYSVAFANDGTQIASGSLDRTVKLWNLEALNQSNTSNSKITSSCEVTYIGHKDFVLSVCSTPNNEYILSGSKDRGVIFWDKNSGDPLLMLQGHRNSVISVSVSNSATNNAGMFATGSGDCKARIWKWTKN